MQWARSRRAIFAFAAVSSSACSLSGEGTGESALLRDAAPLVPRRDGGLDATIESSSVADAEPETPEPLARDASSDARPPGDAGSDADAAGSVCTVAGDYAAQLDFRVEWGTTTLGGIFPVLQAGQGSMRLFAAVHLDPSGAAVLEPCGVTVPDFAGTLLVGGELYGGEVPTTAWDASTMPSFESRWSETCDGPTCDYSVDPVTFLLGARQVGATGAWPGQGAWTASGQYQATDDDNDGSPGLTMLTKGPPLTTADGKPYSFPPVGLANVGRSRKLRLAMLFRAGMAGTTQACGVSSGMSKASDLHVSAVGCTRQPDGATQEVACTASVAQFVDANLPKWTLADTTYKMVRMPSAGSCAAVRQLLTLP
jgi:hypothetical protein